MRVFLLCSLALVAVWLAAPAHASERALLQTPPPKTPQTPPPKGQEAAAKTTTKTATAPVKAGTAPQAPPKQEAGQGRTATTATKQQQPAGTTGQGARAGLGQFEFLAPDAPPVKTSAGRRRALLQTPPPKTPQTPPPKGQEAAAKTTTKTATAPVKAGTAPQAPPKQEAGQGRTATTATKQQQPAGTTGQGARDGLGKFEYLSPDAPPVKTNAGRRRVLQAPPPSVAPPKTTGAPAPGKPTGQAKAPQKQTPPQQGTQGGRVATHGAKQQQAPTGQAGQGARSGLGNFDFVLPSSSSAGLPSVDDRTTANLVGRK